MKQSETTFRNVSMILSFVYSGVSLIAFIVFFVTFLNDGNIFLLEDVVPGYGGPSFIKWMAGILSVVTGMGMVVSLLSGVALLRKPETVIEVDRTKEIEAKVEEKVKNEVDADVLLPGEKKVVEILQRNEGSMTQRELVNESGLSKVKVHRVLKSLEGKKVVTKYSFGMTNRIRLEKKLKV